MEYEEMRIFAGNLVRTLGRPYEGYLVLIVKEPRGLDLGYVLRDVLEEDGKVYVHGFDRRGLAVTRTLDRKDTVVLCITKTLEEAKELVKDPRVVERWDLDQWLDSSGNQGSPGDRAVVTEVELRPHEIEREDLVEVSGRWRRVAYVEEAEADGARRLYHIYFYDGRGLQSRCCTVESWRAIPVRRRRST